MAEQTDDVAADANDSLEVARRHVADWAWAEALDAARSAAGVTGAAEADRLDIVAEASWWLGRLDDCIDAREEAYALYEALGDGVRAGQCAVWLWEHHQLKARPAIAGGVAATSPARPRGGDRTRSRSATSCCGRRRSPTAAATSTEATELAGVALTLGRDLRSLDLEAEALQTIGRLLIDAGEVADGLGHLDEAMLSAVEGRSTRSRPARCTAA